VKIANNTGNHHFSDSVTGADASLKDTKNGVVPAAKRTGIV
jgi:hypothetical protein